MTKRDRSLSSPDAEMLRSQLLWLFQSFTLGHDEITAHQVKACPVQYV